MSGTKEDYTYKTKCRCCGKINHNWFSDSNIIEKKNFFLWIDKKIRYPFQRQCECDNGSVTIQDLVSFSPFI